MRLWHTDLIKKGLLPRTQLLSQWRELNSIYKKQDAHVLINYIYNYSKESLLGYTLDVVRDMFRRTYKINKWSNAEEYFEIQQEDILDGLATDDYGNYLFAEHDREYLMICYWNLKEKYLRGQNDFTKAQFKKLQSYMIQKGMDKFPSLGNPVE